jgi:hypothetical protein
MWSAAPASPSCCSTRPRAPGPSTSTCCPWSAGAPGHRHGHPGLRRLRETGGTALHRAVRRRRRRTDRGPRSGALPSGRAPHGRSRRGGTRRPPPGPSRQPAALGHALHRRREASYGRRAQARRPRRPQAGRLTPAGAVEPAPRLLRGGPGGRPQPVHGRRADRPRPGGGGHEAVRRYGMDQRLPVITARTLAVCAPGTTTRCPAWRSSPRRSAARPGSSPAAMSPYPSSCPRSSRRSCWNGRAAEARRGRRTRTF